MKHLRTILAATTAMLALAPSAVHAISVGELDNFSATLEGWTQGGAPPSGVSRPTANGPAGAGDAFMQVLAGAGGRPKIVTFNQSAAWTGNYVTTQIAAIGMDVNNLGATNLQLRLTFGTAKGPNAGGTWFTSTSAIPVPAASGWQHIQFPIAEANLSQTTGGATYAAVMGGVAAMRLLHSTSLNDQGEALTAILGVDNIKALGPPIPGDFNGSGGVHADDLTKWRGDFGGAGSDADGDADSDGDDFLLWQRHLGEGTSVAAATAVPEPGAAALVMAAALAIGTARSVSTIKTRGRW